MRKRILRSGLSAFLLLSVVVTACGATTLTENRFKNLLSVSDIERAAIDQVRLETRFYDYRKMAAATDPEQVTRIISSWGMIYQTEDELKGITFTIIEFESDTLAKQHLEGAKSEWELEGMAQPIGDSSLKKEFNAGGLGSVIVFRKGRIVGQMLSAMPDGKTPLVTLTGLEGLARKVEQQL